MHLHLTYKLCVVCNSCVLQLCGNTKTRWPVYGTGEVVGNTLYWEVLQGDWKVCCTSHFSCCTHAQHRSVCTGSASAEQYVGGSIVYLLS